MPRFTDENMEQFAIGGSHFQFSGRKVETLGASEETLVLFVIDRSGSIGEYHAADAVNKAVQEAVKSCARSPRADNLMIRTVIFDSEVEEFHGFKPLMDCNAGDYANVCAPRGATALLDAIYNAVGSAIEYAKKLSAPGYDFTVNCVIFVITDGEDNRSTITRKMVAEAISAARRSEDLESIMPILIGVGPGGADSAHLNTYLQTLKDEVGFGSYEFVDRTDEKKLAKLAGFISKSVSSTSQALGSGGPSQVLTI